MTKARLGSVIETIFFRFVSKFKSSDRATIEEKRRVQTTILSIAVFRLSHVLLSTRQRGIDFSCVEDPFRLVNGVTGIGPDDYGAASERRRAILQAPDS